MRHDHRAAVAAVTGYVVAVGGGLLAMVAAGTDLVPVVLLAGVAVVALALWLTRLLGRLPRAVGRLAGDTAVVVDANASRRVETNAPDLRALVEQVNRLAEARESGQRDVEGQVEAARRDLEAERNRLAALMAQLTVAVVVCNAEGRILLYNDAARSVLGTDTPVGLGRSVFAMVDRGLVTHALDRLLSGAESVYTATSLHGDKLLRVRVTPARDPAAGEPGAAAGFVLVLEDLTREARAAGERERVLRELTESVRASLGSIRAAAESVLEFPELSPAEREGFLEIVREESDRLGRRVDDLARGPETRTDDRLLAEIAGDDLLRLVAEELERAGAECAEPVAPDLWVRADAHALARVLAHLVSRVHGDADLRVRLALDVVGRHGQLDVRWPGRPPAPAELERRLDEPTAGAGTSTSREVLERHGAELWGGALDEDTAYLRVLIPLAAGEERAVAPAAPQVPSRPEFYDFDLFAAGPQATAVSERRLDELSFTVFDTETTGLDPAGGDRVISLGAVRVVNGRVLQQETFEQLVAPGRSVPAASTAIHGITADMLAEAPPIEEVLPGFARFAEDTVLVGHNVSFDLQFLAPAEAATGVQLARPALDTLLLHAALHPDHQEHSLDAIAARLGVSVVGRHTALGDALVTAEVFVALAALLRTKGVRTLGEAVELAQRSYQARVDARMYGR